LLDESQGPANVAEALIARTAMRTTSSSAVTILFFTVSPSESTKVSASEFSQPLPSHSIDDYGNCARYTSTMDINKLITLESKIEYRGKAYHLKYSDVDSFDDLPLEKCRQIYGICFLEDKIVIGKNEAGDYSLIGGTIEEGETLEEALEREVQEESNMLVLSWVPIGYQYIEEEDIYQLRTVCLVDPIGPFISDPAGSVIGIETIDPSEFRKYIPWGEIGERIKERAVAKKPQLEKLELALVDLVAKKA
jgi:8-oxo-dGTP pyrophosphatase MutT (NUDIX family)